MAHTYLDTFPAFVPDEAGFDPAEQRRFYGLIKGLYQLAFDEPLLFVPAQHADDAYPNRFNKTPYGKPELLTLMKKFTKEVDALLALMFQMGQGVASVKLNKRQTAILERLGIRGTESLPAAWVWMATREGASLLAFSRCFFKAGHPYMRNVYARLLGDEAAFRKLEGWMIQRGYAYFECLDITASDDKASMTYANPAWSAETPRGGFEYKIRHTGISARYDVAVQTPQVFGLCIPGGLKPYLDAFDRMDGQLQQFIASCTKRCDGCRYCVQTDKTGTRPLAAIPINHEGEMLRLCPYFPGCWFCWTKIDDALADTLIAMLTFMDAMVPVKKK